MALLRGDLVGAVEIHPVGPAFFVLAVMLTVLSFLDGLFSTSRLERLWSSVGVRSVSFSPAHS